MPQLKLTYFDFPGRAEATRLALTIGDIPFEDDRLYPEEFLPLKPTFPYASLPILTVDGVVHAQSAAILRYAGKLTGLYPSDAVAAQHADEIIDVVVDFVAGLESVTDEGQRERQETEEEEEEYDDSMYQIRLLKFVNESVPKFMGGLEHRLKEFGDGPWAIGDGVTVADLAIYSCLLNVAAGAFDHLSMRPMQAYKRIMACFDAVRTHPKVTAWNDDIVRKMELAKQAQEEDHPEEEDEVDRDETEDDDRPS